MKMPGNQSNERFGGEEQAGPRIPKSVWTLLLLGCASAAHAQTAGQSTNQSPSSSYTLPTIQVTGNVNTEAEAFNPQTTVGSKEPLTQREIPQTISVVNQQQIQQQQLTTVDDALRYVPGLKVNNGTYFSRGYQVTTMMLDGVPTSLTSVTNNSIYGGTNGVLLNQYERVEFLSGPAGLYAGFGGAGGTLNLVRKMPTPDFHLTGEVTGGTNSTYRGMLDVSGPLNQSGSLSGRAVISGQTEKLDQYDTWRNNQQFYGVLQAKITDSTTVKLGASYDQDYSKPGLSTGIPAYPDYRLSSTSPKNDLTQNWNRQRLETTNLFTNVETKLGAGWRGVFAANYMNQTDSSRYSTAPLGIDPDTNDLTLFNLKNNFKNEQIDFDTFLQGPVQLFGRTHTLTVGANYARERNKSTINYCSPDNFACPITLNLDDWKAHQPEPDFMGPLNTQTRTTTQYGAYANGRFSLADPLTLVVGARASWWHGRVDPDSDENPFNAPSTSDRYTGKITPYAGLIYDLNDTYSVYASYTKIFQPQIARNSDNQLLKPIDGYQYEAGIKGAYYGGKLNTSLALFQITQKNQAMTDPDDPTLQSSVAAGKSRSKGVEVGASGEILPRWTLYGGYTYTDTEMLDDSNPGFTFSSVAPKHMFKLWTAYQLPGQWSQWTLGAGTTVASKISATDGEGEWVAGGYATVDASIMYQLNPKTSIALTGANLFNRRYYEKVSGISDNFYGDLRRVLLSVRYKM